MVVEVFKTDVEKSEQSQLLTMHLRACFADSKINFDLQDCDKILRIEGENILPEKVVEILRINGYYCETLL